MKQSLRATLKRGSFAGVATAGAAALLLAGCGSAPSASSSGSATKSDYTACMVSDSGGFDDKSFNQSGFEGLQAAAKDLSIQEKHVQSKGDTDYIIQTGVWMLVVMQDAAFACPEIFIAIHNSSWNRVGECLA